MLFLLAAKKFMDFTGKHGKEISIALAWAAFAFGIIQNAVVSLGLFFAKLATIDIDSLKNVNFAAIQYIGYVNAIVPLSEFVGLMTIYLTAWSIVILIRWTKSFIPTIGN